MNNKLFLTGFASEIVKFGVGKEAASPPADIEKLEREVERQKKRISEQAKKDRRDIDWLGRVGLLAGLTAGALYAWKALGPKAKVYQEIAEKYKGFPKTGAAENVEARRKALLRQLRTPRQ